MRRVEILLDDQSDQILTSLAESHDGDLNEAIREVLRTHEMNAAFIDEIEEENEAELIRQKARSEQDFKEGRFRSWDEIKRKARH